MKRSRKIVFTAVAVVTVALSALAMTAVAQNIPTSGPTAKHLMKSPLGRMICGQLMRMKSLGAELNLTPEQKDSIKQILVAQKVPAQPLIKNLVEKRRVLVKAVTAETKDEQAIRAAADELGKSIGDAAVKASDVIAQIKKVLTPEQIQLIEKTNEANQAAVDLWLSEMAKGKE